jgi:hypothetical protein
MAYPSRPVLELLPQFRGTVGTRQTPQQRRTLIEYVVHEFRGCRSLRQLAELTDRTQTAVRRALDEAGIWRRARGANPMTIAEGSVDGRSAGDSGRWSRADFIAFCRTAISNCLLGRLARSESPQAWRFCTALAHCLGLPRLNPYLLLSIRRLRARESDAASPWSSGPVPAHATSNSSRSFEIAH